MLLCHWFWGKLYSFIFGGGVVIYHFYGAVKTLGWSLNASQINEKKMKGQKIYEKRTERNTKFKSVSLASFFFDHFTKTFKSVKFHFVFFAKKI